MRKKQKPNANVGNIIKHSRKVLGLSQMKLAEKIGVSYQMIQKYEKGQSQLTIARLNQFARALGVSPQTFIKGESEAPTPASTFSDNELKLIKRFRKIKNRKHQELAIGIVGDLVKISSSK